MSIQTDELTYRQISEHTEMNRHTERWADMQMDERTGRCTNIGTDKWTVQEYARTGKGKAADTDR
jgi:hypothetical protein